MRRINLRVFRVEFPAGVVTYDFKRSDHSASFGFISIQDLAESVRRLTARLIDEKSKVIQVTIDLQPLHDIEWLDWPVSLTPRRCLPLTEKEKDEFWKELNIAPKR